MIVPVFLLALLAGADPVPVVAIDHAKPVDFDKEIAPILTAKCAGCHSGKARRGNYDMATRAGLLGGGDSGPAIIAGKSVDSLLVQLAGRTKKPAMPPKDHEPLGPRELALIKLWIDQGARGPDVVLRSRPTVKLGSLPAQIHPVRALAISPDGLRLAVARGHEVTVYDPRYGVRLRSLSANGGQAHATIVESLAFSPDGTTLASGSYREVAVWDAATGELKRRLAGFADRVSALAISWDGRLLATGGGVPSADGELRVYDLRTGRLALDLPTAHADTIFGVCFQPFGERLVTASADRQVRVWDLAAGKAVKTLEGHTNYVLDVSWQAFGRMIASAGADQVVKIWDAGTGEQLKTLQGHKGQINHVWFMGFFPIVLSCGTDGTARLWDVNAGTTVRTFGDGSESLNAAVLFADERLVTGGESGEVRVYDKRGKLLRTLVP
jgi:WD40 repeat protein